MVSALVSEIDPAWKIHDFRMVVGETHTNLIFDAVVPFECTKTTAEISNDISEKIRSSLGETYFTVLTIDKE
jgi:hypothetical protein